MRVEAAFKQGGKSYAYEAPEGTEVGDILEVPSFSGGVARVIVTRLEADYPGELTKAYSNETQEMRDMTEGEH